MVAQTSIEAYRSLKDLGNDQRTAHSQIEYMQSKAADEAHLPSRRDIAYELGWETSKVAARVNDLIRYGYVVEAGHKIDKITGKRVKTLATANPLAKKVVERIEKETWSPSAVSWMND